MDADEKYYTIKAMQSYGGGFASALAEAWAKADMNNSARIEAAFPDLIEKYGPQSAFYKAV